jgi:hypothetical protein
MTIAFLPTMKILASTIVLPVLFLASAAVADPSTAPTVEATASEPPPRTRRPIALSVSPDLYVFHVQKFPDAVVMPFALRLTGNLTPRIALTASCGGFPNFIKMCDVGATVAAFDTPLTPYAGIDVGAVITADDDSPGTTDPFVIGVVGVTYVTSFGLDVAAEGGSGYQRDGSGGDARSAVMLRLGVRAGFRFGVGS